RASGRRRCGGVPRRSWRAPVAGERAGAAHRPSTGGGVQPSHLEKSTGLPRCSSSAVIAALQQAMSSLVCPPDTPTPPTTSPSTSMGQPPTKMVTRPPCGVLIPTASSLGGAFVHVWVRRRWHAAVNALLMAISTDVGLPPSMRRRAMGQPPASLMQMTDLTPCRCASATAASSMSSASSSVSTLAVRTVAVPPVGVAVRALGPAEPVDDFRRLYTVDHNAGPGATVGARPGGEPMTELLSREEFRTALEKAMEGRQAKDASFSRAWAEGKL